MLAGCAGLLDNVLGGTFGAVALVLTGGAGALAAGMPPLAMPAPMLAASGLVLFNESQAGAAACARATAPYLVAHGLCVSCVPCMADNCGTYGSQQECVYRSCEGASVSPSNFQGLWRSAIEPDHLYVNEQRQSLCLCTSC